MKNIANILMIILVLLSLAACQNNESSKIEKEEFIITETWMRPGVKDRNSAAFMKITNNTNSPDTLLSVSSDLAKKVELHETFVKENDMKGMRHIDLLPIPIKSTVELKPGSYHIMLIGLNNDLKIGDSGKIELIFKNAGIISLVSVVE